MLENDGVLLLYPPFLSASMLALCNLFVCLQVRGEAQEKASKEVK